MSIRERFVYLSMVGLLALWIVSNHSPAVGQNQTPAVALDELGAQVKMILADNETLKESLAQDRTFLVPPGGMIPYFSAALPAGFAWANGDTVWLDENQASWVPQNLRAAPDPSHHANEIGFKLPDMSNGKMLAATRPASLDQKGIERQKAMAVGDVWDNGFVRTPGDSVKGEDFSIRPLNDKSFGDWPFGHGSAGPQLVPQEYRDLMFVTMVITKDPALLDFAKGARGAGIAGQFQDVSFDPLVLSSHRDWPTLITKTFGQVAFDIGNIAHSGSLFGTSPIPSHELPVVTSDSDPPCVTCNWIIRVK